MSRPFTINIYNVPNTVKPLLTQGSTASVDITTAITSSMTYDTDHWTVTIDDGYDATPFNIFAVGFETVECAYYVNATYGNNTRNIYMISKTVPRKLCCWHTCVSNTNLSWNSNVYFNTEDLFTETPNPTTSSKLFLRDGTEISSADFIDSGIAVKWFKLANTEYIGFTNISDGTPVGGDDWTFARNSTGDIVGQLDTLYAYTDSTLTAIPVYAWVCDSSTFMPEMMVGSTTYTREIPEINSSARTCNRSGTYSIEGVLQRTGETTGQSTGLGYTYTYVRDPDNDFIAYPQTIYSNSLSLAHNQTLYNNNGEDAKLKIDSIAQDSSVTSYNTVYYRQLDPFQSSELTTTQSIWRDIAYGSNKFVAIDGNSRISTSTNGTTWSTPVDLSLGQYSWNNIVYDGTQFVASSGIGPYISTSTDGTTWSTPVNTSPGLNESWRQMIYDGTKFILIGINGHVVTTTDLTTWIDTGTDLGSNSWYGIAYNGLKYIALTQKGQLAYSTDCINWSSINNNSILTVDDKWLTIKTLGEMFVVLSSRGYYAFSIDGENWSKPKDIVYTTTPSTTKLDWRAVCPTTSYGIILMSGWGMICSMRKI